MKRLLFLWVSFIVALTVPLLHAAEAVEPSDHGTILPEILILNSYHPGFAFSDDEQAGVIEVIRAKDKNWLPVVEYMDLKRLPDGKHLAELKKLFRLKYRNKKFSVVIAMDNPALEFAVDNQAELFGNAPIVFCGINNYTPSLLKGHTEVTGIVEAIDIAGTIEVMLRLHPAAREIFIPHDHTATGLEVPKAIEALIPRFGAKVRFRFTDPMTMEELLKELERLPWDSLVLPISFLTDKSGRTFGMTETARLFSKHSPVPVYSTFEQRLGFGIVGGKLLSARIHGANAGRIALRVLAGEKASAIPVVFESDSQFMFDYKVMSRFGIPLSALPEGSTLINKPVSFYAAHRVVIQTALGIVIFLAVVIFLLTINIIQRRRSVEVIRRSEERFKVITSSTPDHLIVQDKDLRYSFVMNPQLGLTEQDMIGKTDHDFLSKEDADKLTKIKREVLNTGNPAHVEVPLISSKGEQEFFDGSYIPKFDIKGQVDGLIGYFKNVTDRKRMAQVHAFLAETSSGSTGEPFFNTLARHLAETLGMDFVCIDRLEGDELTARTVAVWSDGHFEDNMTYALKDTPCGEVVGKQICCFPDTVRQLFPRDQALQDLRAESYVGVTLWSHTGQPIGLIAVIGRRPLVNRPLAEATLKVVAIRAAAELERLEAENALRRSEENFRLSLDDSPLGVRIVTEEGETIYANRAILDIYGYDSTEELNTTPIKKRYSPESYAEFQIRKEKREQGDDVPSEYDISIVRKDGEVRQLQVFRNPTLWDGERQFQVVYQDITERKRAEEEKRRMEERSRKVVEDIFRFIPEGVLVFSRKMEVLRQNQAFRELVSGYAKRLGFAEDELENLIVDKIKAAMGDENIKEIRISRKHETGEQT